MPWKCPDCGGDNLEVDITTRAKLIQDEEDEENFQTDVDESECGDHEWGAESMMFCMNGECGYLGLAAEFDTYNQMDINTEDEPDTEDLYTCAKCGVTVGVDAVITDPGTGPELGNMFYYCSVNCKERH